LKFAVVLGMLIKEFAECLDFLQRPLYVIQPLYGEDDSLPSGLLAKRGDMLVGFGALADTPDVVHIYTHGLGSQPDGVFAHGDLFGHLVDAESAAVGEELFGCIDAAKYLGGCVAFYHIHEIFYIPWNVEADEITLQKAADDLMTPRDDVEDICRRESRVVKESDSEIGAQLPQVRGYHPQVVFVDPHVCAVLGLGGHPVCKQFVDLEVVLPMVVIKLGLADK